MDNAAAAQAPATVAAADDVASCDATSDRARSDTALASSSRPSPALTAELRHQRLEDACRILTERHMAITPSRSDREKHTRSVLAGKLADHRDHAHRLLHVNPDLTPAILADLLEPPAPPAAPAAAARPAPDPYAGQRAARDRAAAENAQRLAAETAGIDADPDRNVAGIDAARQRLRPAQEPPDA